MINQNIFLQFLYLLSTQEISQSLYLEGGAALSFVYGLNRVFSNDLDFTIDSDQLRPSLSVAVKEIMTLIDIGQPRLCESGNNQIIIKDGQRTVLQLDVYVLPAQLFLWEERVLRYGRREFTLKVHSLMDILAEKISNLFQEDRCEFKDIVDINNIFNLLGQSFNQASFKSYLRQKLIGKKIYPRIKNNPAQSFLARKANFLKSFSASTGLSHKVFSQEFSRCQVLISQCL